MIHKNYIVEEKHPGLTKMVNRFSEYLREKLDQNMRCRVMGCDEDCEQCEAAFMNAQDARRDVLRYVDEHYQQIAL